MKSYDINTLLNQLVALTQGRDDIAIETKLIDILMGLISETHSKNADAVAIYHTKSFDGSKLSKLTHTKNEPEAAIHEDLKLAILNCFKTGDVQLHQVNGKPFAQLYPLKNFSDKVVSVVEIQTSENQNHKIDLEQESVIRKMLHVYQNFTRLMNDNECDTLTGLLNRKTFDYKINKIITQMHAGAKRKDDRAANFYSIAIFDIDHFKRVNDNFGHLIGDEVLLLFSQQLKHSFRDTDPLFRFGGEEFVGVFACTNEEDIAQILERFRSKIEQFTFPQVGKVTVSTGYCAIQEFDSPSQMVDRADSALYFAKNNGRNRVENYDELIASGKLQVNSKEGDIELF